MGKYILNTDNYIKITNISFKNFIKIHQFLEDNGHVMYKTTKERIEQKQFNYQYFGSKKGDELCGHDGLCDKNIIPYQEIIDIIENKTPTYEIY